MKIFFIAGFLALLASVSFAQWVQSSCDAPDSVKELYRDDVAEQALFYETIIHSPYRDSVEIPTAFQNIFEKIFNAIYNAADLAARDSILKYDIHDYARFTFLHKILFTFDTTLLGVSASASTFFQRRIPNSIVSSKNMIL